MSLVGIFFSVPANVLGGKYPPYSYSATTWHNLKPGSDLAWVHLLVFYINSGLVYWRAARPPPAPLGLVPSAARAPRRRPRVLF